MKTKEIEKKEQKSEKTKKIRSKHKEKSKQRILDATARLFAQKGYDGAGIREICAEADTNICMVSYFWGGKKALYSGIIKDLAEKQSLYAAKFMNIDLNPKILSAQEQVALLYETVDKIMDFLYGGWISNDMYRFLIQEQQNNRIDVEFPLFIFLKKIVAAIFKKETDDRNVILKTLFIMAQINAPIILPAFSLRLLDSNTFQSEDINIIKNNVKLYIKALLDEINV